MLSLRRPGSSVRHRPRGRAGSCEVSVRAHLERRHLGTEPDRRDARSLPGSRPGSWQWLRHVPGRSAERSAGKVEVGIEADFSRRRRHRCRPAAATRGRDAERRDRVVHIRLQLCDVILEHLAGARELVVRANWTRRHIEAEPSRSDEIWSLQSAPSAAVCVGLGAPQRTAAKVEVGVEADSHWPPGVTGVGGWPPPGAGMRKDETASLRLPGSSTACRPGRPGRCRRTGYRCKPRSRARSVRGGWNSDPIGPSAPRAGLVVPVSAEGLTAKVHIGIEADLVRPRRSGWGG